MMDYHDAALNARKPVDALLAGVARCWENLGLSPEDTAERVLNIETKLEAVANSLLDTEKVFLAKVKEEVASARQAAQDLAEDLGQKLARPKLNLPLYAQLDDAKRELKRLDDVQNMTARRLTKAMDDMKALAILVGEEARLIDIGSTLEDVQEETERLEAKKLRLSEELAELTERISKEVERMGADPEQYEIPSSATGIEGVRLANAQVKKLEQLASDRIGNIQRIRARVRKHVAELGEPIEFRIAHDGELLGLEDGVCILAKSRVNEQFMRDLARFEGARDPSVVSSARFEKHMKHLESEYTLAVELQKRAGGPSKKTGTREKTRSRSARKEARMTYSPETCRSALKSLAGDWEDTSGMKYRVRRDNVTRDDGKQFLLVTDKGRINWTRSGRYFLDPTANFSKEAIWICDRTRRPAFSWERVRRRAQSRSPRRRSRSLKGQAASEADDKEGKSPASRPRSQERGGMDERPPLPRRGRLGTANAAKESGAKRAESEETSELIAGAGRRRAPAVKDTAESDESARDKAAGDAVDAVSSEPEDADQPSGDGADCVDVDAGSVVLSD